MNTEPEEDLIGDEWTSPVQEDTVNAKFIWLLVVTLFILATLFSGLAILWQKK